MVSLRWTVQNEDVASEPGLAAADDGYGVNGVVLNDDVSTDGHNNAE